MKMQRILLLMILCSTIDVFSQTQVTNVAYHPSKVDSLDIVPERMDFTYAAERVQGSVVHIRTFSKDAYSQMPDEFEEILREFYGDQYSPKTNPKGKDTLSEQEFPLATGSGVIASTDGYIITSSHIVENADRIEVALFDKRTYSGKLVGNDPNTDVALIKIDQSGLTPIKYGNSDQVKVGEWVLAVGNPFNLNSTVTAGIVSAKGRNINILGSGDENSLAIESFIQTDAAVNPGNSGGALVNIRGELIGINTAIATPTGSYAGYAFAVPVNLARKVIDDILEFGQVQRAILGVVIQEVTAPEVRAKGIKDYNGVYVMSVNKAGSADEAGLMVGDIITKVNGFEVNSPSEVQAIIGTRKPGDKVKVQFKRNDKVMETEVTLKNLTGTTDLIKYDDNAAENKSGAEFAEVSRDELRKLGIHSGVKVAKVKSGKFKDKGIKEGFIITHIDRTPVRSVKDLKIALSNINGRGVMIQGKTPKGKVEFYAVGF